MTSSPSANMASTVVDAFVRNIIYEICGWEQFQTMEADYDTVKSAVEPALDYLRSLNPYDTTGRLRSFSYWES